MLVCVQRVATLIKRHDNFIYTKKSNIIDSSWCYLFKSGGGGGGVGRGKFTFNKKVDAIFKTLRNVLICY